MLLLKFTNHRNKQHKKKVIYYGLLHGEKKNVLKSMLKKGGGEGGLTF